MITAGVLADERDRYLELGMDGFLSKPSSIAALKDKLAELLPDPSLDEVEKQSSDHPAEFSRFLDLLKGNKGQVQILPGSIPSHGACGHGITGECIARW